MKVKAAEYNFLKRLVIVEDNLALRSAYNILLKGAGSYQVVGLYGDCESALENFGKDKPDLILIDLNLPGMNGVEGIKQFIRIDPKIRILVVTVHDDSPHVFDALCAGAIGYITKDSNHQELIAAIEQVSRGGAPMSTRIANMIVRSFHVNSQNALTEIETTVLKQLSHGKTYDFIAQDLNVTKDTVKIHIRDIYEKLQVNNKSEAIIKAKRDNLV